MLKEISPADDDRLVVNMATRGLVAFRSGNADEGARLYLDAIELAKKSKANNWLAFRAWLFFAYETAWAAPGTAKETLDLLDKRVGRLRKSARIPQHILSEFNFIRAEISSLNKKTDLFLQAAHWLEKLKNTGDD